MGQTTQGSDDAKHLRTGLLPAKGSSQSYYMQDNSDRRERQKKTDIQVIIGNPPYSAGQKSANDNAQNVAYPGLDGRIAASYARGSAQTSVKNLYDSYIRAIRWGSDRIGDAGVMAYVSGSAWIERAFADGMRKSLADEFASIHVFHLRGDIRKNILSDGKAGEGGNVFGQDSMTGVAITIFVKNPVAKKQDWIFFHDIGDDLNQQQKLDIIRRFGSVGGISRADGWTRINPDRHGDWLDQRDDSLEAFLKVGDKKDKSGKSLFGQLFSLGVATGRDLWCINPSKSALRGRIEATIAFYNGERRRWARAKEEGVAPAKAVDFLNPDPKRISWTVNVRTNLEKGKPLALEDGQFVPCMYRPFTKQWQFYSRRFNERVYQMPRIFPNADLPNRVIAVTGKGGRSGFSALMMDALPSLDTIEKGQCFPFWLYEKVEKTDEDLLWEQFSGYRCLDAITEYGVKHFCSAYPSETVTREDIFYYVYGLLHSEDYRARFRDNLTKELPRIPCVKDAADFRAFRDAGWWLGELHVGYERAAPYPATIDTGGHDLHSVADPAAFFQVVKMKHPGSGRKKDRSTVIYNHNITIRDIPDAAWEYVVNGKPALAWVMERQCVRTDKASGIVSDANRYAVETVGDPRYPLDLFLRLITVSFETVKIVRSLPELDIDGL